MEGTVCLSEKPTAAELALAMDDLRKVTKFAIDKGGFKLTDEYTKLGKWLAAGAPYPLSALTGGNSLDEAKHSFEATVDEGSECPCCGRYGKRYCRKLNSGMSRALIRMCRYVREEKPQDGWIFTPDVKDVDLHHLEFHKLRFWKLIEPKPEQKVEGRTSGTWRITPLGFEFAENKVTVPKHAYEFGSEFHGYPDPNDKVNITQTLGEKFNWNELMYGIKTP